MENKVLDTQYVYLKMKNGILYATYKQDLNVTIEVAKDMVKSRLEFIEGRSYPTLIYSQGVLSVNKKARDYLSSEEGTQGVIAGAFMLDSVFSKFVINFYLRITNPTIPSRIFTEEEKALKWLEQYNIR